MKRILSTIIFTLVVIATSMGQNEFGLQQNIMADDSITVSLLTADPGPMVFELYGHEAVRVKTSDSDIVFNYGLFEYRQKGFVLKFINGQTDYMAGACSFDQFMAEYEWRGSKVTEQILNPTQPQAQRFYELLQHDVMPQNRVYRYDYARNNCATKVLDRIDDAIGGKVTYPDTLRFGTYRKELAHFHRNYPWYRLSIDLILGSEIDRQLKPRDEMFIPVILQLMADNATLPDGKPLVKSTKTVYAGRGDVTLPPTSPLLSPVMVFCVVLILVLLVCRRDTKRRRLTKWAYTLWFAAEGCAGVLVSQLIFISEHFATSPNIIGWWLNPLWFIPAVTIHIGRLRKPTAVMLMLHLLMTAGMCIALPWSAQNINAATIPLIATSLLMSICGAKLLYCKNNNTKTGTAK